MFSLFYEYSNLEYVHIRVIYRVHQAEYNIRIRVAAPEECVKTYSTRRWGHHTQTHDRNSTTNDHTKNHPLTKQRSKVARRRCVPPPTTGWVARTRMDT